MSEVAEKVKSIIAEHLGIDDLEKITNDAKFIDDLGADSLDTVELVMAFEEAFDVEIPDEKAEKILKNNNISAIFCADDTMAFGCIDYIKKETKLRIPNQIEIVGYDDMIMANWNSYNLSTIRQPIRQMSKLTTQLIDDYLQDPDFEPANHLIEGKFIKRKTTKNSL